MDYSFGTGSLFKRLYPPSAVSMKPTAVRLPGPVYTLPCGCGGLVIDGLNDSKS